MSNAIQKKKIMSNTTAIISAAASVAGSIMLIRTITNEFIPNEVRIFFSSQIHDLKRYFSSELTIVIEEFQGVTRNKVYEAAEVYLGTKATVSAQRVKARKSEDDKNLAFVVDKNEEVCDDYEGVVVRWKLNCISVESSSNRNDFNSNCYKAEIRSYELSFHKKHKDMIFNSYLPYVLERSKAIKDSNMAVKLHTIEYDYWSSDAVKFSHPMNFKTLAIDAELKREILDDLDRFVKGKEFYKRTGKAWKRGYLLYGPPGTGKSSLIAAMAHYLNYDIYDLDLTAVCTNNDLKNLILGMSNRSILVIEDIDCTIKLQNREDNEPGKNEDKKHPIIRKFRKYRKGKRIHRLRTLFQRDSQVTLSGLLNAIDGLWSCCGEERMIVFTTNHREKLDPALLRPGRMDMHIHLSYCSFSAFQQLAFNYHGITHHKLFPDIQVLLGQVQVTPAEIAGELTKSIHSKEPMQDLVQFLNSKRMVEE